MFIWLFSTGAAASPEPLPPFPTRRDVVEDWLRADPGVRGAGLFRGVEAESGRAFVGHGRRAWVDAEGWKSELTRFGIDYLHLPTDEPILGKLRHFLGRRGFGSKVR